MKSIRTLGLPCDICGKETMTANIFLTAKGKRKIDYHENLLIQICEKCIDKIKKEFSVPFIFYTPATHNP